MTALLITAALFCSQFDQELAIAIAINAQQPQQQSVVVEPAPAVAKYTTRQETRYRWVRQRYNCRGGQCSYRMVKQAYTVTVQVPAASAANTNWPSYPTTPRQRALTQGGRHITWRHLTTGEHAGKFSSAWLQTLTQTEIEQLHADDHENKVQWAYVVRP